MISLCVKITIAGALLCYSAPDKIECYSDKGLASVFHTRVCTAQEIADAHAKKPDFAK